MVRSLTCGRFRLTLGGRTLVMGILNVTPDSFSDGGRYFDHRKAVERGLEMAQEGADLIDVGGESTRPYAHPVDTKEELRRILPVVEHLSRRLKIPISVDTWKAEVAKEAIQAGASLVNDASGLRDPEILKVVVRAKVPIILMHTRGTPQTMMAKARYRHLIPEILGELRRLVRRAVRAGVARDSILLDPGIGFAKTARHSLSALKHLSEFKRLRFPLVVGPSRKSFIGHVLGVPVEDRIFGTAAAVAWTAAQGVEIVRVHDVKAMRHVVDLIWAILKQKR
jgi:dihydropteroate synthase